jgi:hypothetical protein
VLGLDLDSYAKFGHGAEATVRAMAYLVLFVADPAEDRHADALRDVARSIPGAGFFDGGEPGDERTIGTYLRTDSPDEDGARALVEAMAAFAARMGVRVEVQYDERVLGHLEADGRHSDEFTGLGGS